MSTTDRQRGALLGLAIADALGAAVEFKLPGTFEPVTGYRAGGPHGLDPGQWTDDTSMALALADSIAEVGWDINDQAERYLRWWPMAASGGRSRPDLRRSCCQKPIALARWLSPCYEEVRCSEH